MVMVNEAILPILASALMLGANGAVLSFVFFYLYEIGYVHNDRQSSLRSKLISIIVLRVGISLFLLWLLPSVIIAAETNGTLYLALLVFCVFFLHNVLAEKADFRVLTWLLLNVGKWGVYLGPSFFLAAPIFIPRLFNYLAHKGKAVLDYDKRKLEVAMAATILVVAVPLMSTRCLFFSAILFAKFGASTWLSRKKYRNPTN